MGKNNRQRRQEKQRKRDRRRAERDSGPAPSGPGGFRYVLDEVPTEVLVRAAAIAIANGDDGAAAAIAGVAVRTDARRCAAGAVQELIDGLTESCWELPLLTNLVRRRLSLRHARLLVEGVDAAEDVGAAIEVVAMLLRLPPLLPLPRPVQVDDASAKVLGRVRALLAKAESTTFPAEAEALSAKAQQLMARHAIDHALASGQHPLEVPGGRRLPLEDPYADAKALLLGAVASANRCRSVHVVQLGHATVLGFESDLVAVEVLFTSLLIQANRALLAAGRNDASSRRRGFRSSFLSAYGTRIGQRLAAATAEEVAGADADHGGRLLPVLVARSDAVEDAVAAMFGGRLVSKQTRISDPRGWVAGHAAADLADLAVGPEVRAG